MLKKRPNSRPIRQNWIWCPPIETKIWATDIWAFRGRPKLIWVSFFFQSACHESESPTVVMCKNGCITVEGLGTGVKKAVEKQGVSGSEIVHWFFESGKSGQGSPTEESECAVCGGLSSGVRQTRRKFVPDPDWNFTNAFERAAGTSGTPNPHTLACFRGGT